ALPRPHGVDRTPGRPVVKHAVAIALLAQAPAPCGGTRIQAGHFFNTLTPVFGQGGDFLFVDPDVPRRSGAAVAATGTAKAEPLLVPWFSHWFRRSWCSRCRERLRYHTDSE